MRWSFECATRDMPPSCARGARGRRARRAVARLHDGSEVSFRAGQGGSRAWEGALGRAWALGGPTGDGGQAYPHLTCWLPADPA